MGRFFFIVVAAIWFAWLLSWHIASRWRDKPTVKAPRTTYRWHIALVALGYLLTFAWFPNREIYLWPVGAPLGWAMVALTLAGVAFAWWARIHLGKLWSGGVERMAAHRVVDSGPYAIVRHPIYSGLIAGLTAEAVIHATPLALLGPVLFATGFALKAKVEERFLETELGGYGDYKRRVPMLVPLARFGAR